MPPLGRLLVTAITIAIPLEAQEARLVASGPPAVKLPYEFTRISAVHELRDGRVVVIDRLLGEVRLADPRTGLTPMLGRSGDGPWEYWAPFGLIPLGGDSVGIYDDANVRILVVTANGQLGGFVSPFSTAEGTRLGGLGR